MSLYKKDYTLLVKIMADNPAPQLIRALKLPLRDVHDLCSTGDLEYLVAFAKDEEHRLQQGLGRAYSPSRKPTAPIRRAEFIQSSKIAEEARKLAEEKEERARKKKKELLKQKRKEAAEAEARLDSGGDDYADSQDGGNSAREDHLRSTQPAAQDDEESVISTELERIQQRERALKNPLLSSGAGAKDQDKVPTDRVFPRPRLGQTQAAATEDAIFNTVGLGVVTVHDLINFRDEHGFLPIHTACIFGQSDIVDFLIQHGADIESEAPNTLYRPLHLAVLNGHDHLARRLVETYNADPGCLTSKFELPLTIAKRRRAAVEQLYYKEKCLQRLKSSNALEAAKNGDVLFFAYHIECDDDQGKEVFTNEKLYAAGRPTGKAPESSPGASAISVETVIRDPVATPLDVALACIPSTSRAVEVKNHLLIVKLLLNGKYYNLNELRESPIATTSLYLAVSIPVAREAIKLLLNGGGADPRVASTFNAASNQIIKLMLAEAEAKLIFDETYSTRDDVEFSERQEFVNKVTELRTKWKTATFKLQKALDREEMLAAAEGSS